MVQSFFVDIPDFLSYNPVVTLEIRSPREVLDEE
jgi:hypothetical protein